MIIETQASGLILIGPLTTTSFTAKVNTLTRPSGSGVYDFNSGLPHGVNLTPNQILIKFFGTGSDNDTFDIRLWGWDAIKAAGDSSKVIEWCPTLLGDWTCTISGSVAAASADTGPLTSSHRMVDTIVRNDGLADGVGMWIVSPEEDLVGHVICDILGHSIIEFDTDRTGATAGGAVFRGI